MIKHTVLVWSLKPKKNSLFLLQSVEYQYYSHHSFDCEGEDLWVEHASIPVF